ncbi:hypothetical protein DFJ58DRAFT_718238 [Suillus subalutaceus]|uniref:uncharacterized protein n=1 Tax=Suillus subalutaceus TaxID=48586 RepID=UPI001B87AAAB|nr:uncharacterized protein DFJ58DRAFT_718238 [Suillus subalutaceus]KAG1840997.1 hypothetical protein DFJ58DRAFT_718238 [Suillus subalutaceus]
MSRIPQPSPRPTPAASASSPRVRTKSVPKSPSKAIRRPPPVENEPPVPKPILSIKEAVALKRAEARKAVSTSSSRVGLGNSAGFERRRNTPELGRWSVKETIERARSTGAINLSSRSLPCIPSAFSVASEPPISSSTDASSSSRRTGQREGPAWFEAQDLHVLKVWNNDIVEIQHEISLFGSLKTVDYLSHNSLAALPSNIFALPNLTLSFGARFSKSSSQKARNDTFSSGGFFGPVITRASSPLPRLSVLDASHNKLTAFSIDHANLPPCIIRALSHLNFSRNFVVITADIGDDAFPSDLFHFENPLFPSACNLRWSGLKQDITYDFTTEQPPEGTLRVSVGKKVVREAWEIEAERRVKSRVSKSVADAESTGGSSKMDVGQNNADVVKEAWEIEAEHSLIGHGRPPTPASTLATIIEHKFNESAILPCYHSNAHFTPALSSDKESHARSFSLATPFSSAPSSQGKLILPLPTLTLPLVAISAQSFAQTLKILVLRNRKFDLCVSLPTTGEVLLPSLEELVLDGCGFGDQVSVLRTLDLSYNALTSASLRQDILSSLILADNSNSRKGLRHLRLRGNRIDELDAFQGIADLFKGNQELDLRDNEISKLPAELGLCLWTFRIPQRKVWEREGTRGLLSWLRGRLE